MKLGIIEDIYRTLYLETRNNHDVKYLRGYAWYFLLPIFTCSCLIRDKNRKWLVKSN